VRWEQAGIAAQTSLLGLSLCLWPVAHRGPQDAWQPEALPAGRQNPDVQDTRRTGALPAGPEPRYMWQCRNPSYQGGGFRSHWTRGNTEAHFYREAGPVLLANDAK
jgi:hypothetical protein